MLMTNTEMDSGVVMGIEEEILMKGLTAPRIFPHQIDAVIKSEEYHVFEMTQLTICVLTLANGFTVTGESACVSPENFDEAIGQRISRDNAKEKIWGLLGFLLAERESGVNSLDL